MTTIEIVRRDGSLRVTYLSLDVFSEVTKAWQKSIHVVFEPQRWSATEIPVPLPHNNTYRYYITEKNHVVSIFYKIVPKIYTEPTRHKLHLALIYRYTTTEEWKYHGCLYLHTSCTEPYYVQVLRPQDMCCGVLLYWSYIFIYKLIWMT